MAEAKAKRRISRKAWRRIILASSISLIAALIIVVIVLATVRINFFPTVNDGRGRVFHLQSAEHVMVRQGSRTVIGLEGSPSRREIRELEGIWRDSFSATFLSASSNGASGSNQEFQIHDSRHDFRETNVNSVVAQYAFTMEFRFGTEVGQGRRVFDANGRTFYRTPPTSQRAGEAWEVFGVIIAIPRGGGFERMNMYLITGNASQVNATIGVVIRTFADYTDLYARIREISNEPGRLPPQGA